ncbi:helix-turn-helix transcriptional regulator [Frigoribacterium faeni]|uniref:DNA-binding protein n=1 Tax=Frigoribacterium faeni TaxID=145483 RepID=A0A7W3JH51_9MICO|nr:helix-turn-helix transcriptional regulator [Frigoribacterium faeni]MBA8812754.1 transcriptional regulator with XRE-family HTH domain [Frigoribacterium faeni]GEK82380.1 DNA-binding protein [Frigoribacterium faeni]
MDRAELADFLRHRREALRPSDVGLPEGERRRTAGLRREEVAGLVGMSTDYYARLEQQRGPQPSEQMVIALTRGLRLSLDERDHLYRLTGHHPPRRSRGGEHVSPALMRVLDRLDDTPALVLSDLAETLAQNRLATALLGDQTRHEGWARSAFYRWFTDPAERASYPVEDHPHQLELQASGLRAALSMAGGGGRARDLVETLLTSSPEFETLWRRHAVHQRFDDRKTLVHPELGRIEVGCQALFTEDQSQTLLVLTATPGSPDAEKLRLLGVIGTQEFAG